MTRIDIWLLRLVRGFVALALIGWLMLSHLPCRSNDRGDLDVTSFLFQAGLCRGLGYSTVHFL